eukprot:TRINITY_DN26299_c0_g1_i1.p1 TRINITY_DN26299_c0_g1~~TRINITY_DN26299_c0_g1_i1.p1  ORF type:complete len:292 (-),score=52.87 TRINITY_DN26299_c0_g1_i1:127-1002(-)
MAPLSPNGLWYPRSRSNSPTKPSSPHTKNYPTPPSSGSFETFAIRQIIALTALTALTSPSLHHKLGTHHVLLSASAWAGTIVQTVVGWFGLADRSDEMRAHSSVALWLTLTLGVSGLILTRVPSYGKLSDGGSWDIGWLYGPGIPTKMAWVIQETPAFAICGILFLEAIDELGLAQRVVCLMFLLHYFHRSFVYPLQIRGGKPIPILLCICAIAFCSANGYIQGRAITQFTPHLQSASWAFDPRFILGSFVFLLGRNVNLHSDDVLRNLRSSSDSKAVSYTHLTLPTKRIV